MNGYDIDGVLTAGLVPEEPYVVVSGRTHAEYDDFCRELAQTSPVYIRGSGEYGDRQAAGEWKAQMVAHLGITKFFEDDYVQADIIREKNPDCRVILCVPA